MNSEGKQARTPRKQKVMTLEQARQAILDLVDSGVHYREIAPIEFNIGGRKKHFGILDISGIVKEREEKEKPHSRSEADVDAELSKLFEAEKSSRHAVTKLHITFKIADAKFK